MSPDVGVPREGDPFSRCVVDAFPVCDSRESPPKVFPPTSGPLIEIEDNLWWIVIRCRPVHAPERPSSFK